MDSPETCQRVDPYFARVKAREAEVKEKNWIELPGPHRTPHQWQGALEGLVPGTHVIEIHATTGAKTVTGKRIVRILP